jgi:hypothetical protein
MWLLATTASGKITAQSTSGICHPGGTRLLESIKITTNMEKLITNASQKRRRIRGTSMKKFDRLTSLVAPHVMLYAKRCAKRAWDKWIDRPPKKKLRAVVRNHLEQSWG